MSSEVLINIRPNQTRVAYIEDGQLIDLSVEKKRSPTHVGSIYCGVVKRVLPGMQSAFVDIGLERAAFLYVGDLSSNLKSSANIFDEGEELVSEEMASKVKEVEKIQDMIKEGQKILVQISRDSIGTKGARITTNISLAGRNVVYMPQVNHIGISRKIEDETERDRLKALVEKINLSGGAIVRTAGEGATEESMQRDFDYLNRLWKDIQKNYNKKNKPGVVFSDLDIELRVLRDMLNDKVNKVVVDNDQAFKKINSFLTQFLPKFKKNVIKYEEKQALFDAYNIELEISRSIQRKIWLKSGGYIVLDEAEALTVIDVNTGKFVGKKDFEETIFKTNLEALYEIAHQMRIRNTGGIIIVDFIDMASEVNRSRILDEFGLELKKDKARTQIITMSELGLVEMTRKRSRPSLTSILTESCPYCEGKGHVKKAMTVSHEIFRGLEKEFNSAKESNSCVIHCQPAVADWVYEQEGEMLDYIEKKFNVSLGFKPDKDFHVEEFELYFS